MGRKKQIKLILEPTRIELLEKVNLYTNFEKTIINLIITSNENLFSFICGIITNIPLTVLFNLITFKVDLTRIGISIFLTYIAFLIISSLLTFYMIKFTVKHIEIKQETDRITNKEIYVNKLFENVISMMKKLKKYLLFIIIFATLSISMMIMLFILNNL